MDEHGEWDPADEYWGEGPIETLAQGIIARGPRPMYEMEQVLPGADPEQWDSDPITESNDRKDAGDVEGARDILRRLVEADLRCLDAHAHLGNMVFDRWPEKRCATTKSACESESCRSATNSTACSRGG